MRFEDLNAEKAKQLGSEEKWLTAQDLMHNNLVHFRYRTPDRLEAAVQDNDNWYPTRRVHCGRRFGEFLLLPPAGGGLVRLCSGRCSRLAG